MGSRPNSKPSSSTSPMPVRNSGIELPMIISVLAVTSRFEPGRSAASTPTGIATMTTTNRLSRPSSSVATTRRSKISFWGICVTSVKPRSPCSRLKIQRP